ncbi:MAG: O-antigen ligase family protein [Planctomycetaceae bacterium]|nr:O-antigen ligase family protein [Planctomycetaceae bacterium]
MSAVLTTSVVCSPVRPRSVMAPWLLCGGITLLVGLIFLTDEHRWDRSGLTDYVESAEERATAATAGNAARRSAFLVLGLSGGVLLLCSGNIPVLREPLGLSLMLAAGWTAVSLMWADSPSFTLKRLLLLVLCAVGILGIASTLTIRRLAVVTLLVTGAYLGMGVFAEVSLGNFRPWAGGYRFAGTLHPNAQATNCGAMALAAFAVWKGAPADSRTRTTRLVAQLALLLFVVALGFLLLTKSRTAIAAVVLVMGLVWATRWRMGTNLIVAGCGLLAMTVLSYSLMLTGTQDVSDSASFGRADSQGALNGRLPIWEICVQRMGSRLPVGFGYDGFWTPERIEDVSWELGWSISSAHSEYIEIVLGLGVVGLALYVLTQTLAIGWFWLRYFRLGHGADAMVLGLLLIGAIQGFMETSYLHPSSFAPFICLTAMVRLACFSDHNLMWKEAV